MRLYIFDNDDYAVKIADLLSRHVRAMSTQILVDGFGTIAVVSDTPNTRRQGPLVAPRRSCVTCRPIRMSTCG